MSRTPLCFPVQFHGLFQPCSSPPAGVYSALPCRSSLRLLLVKAYHFQMYAIFTSLPFPPAGVYSALPHPLQSFAADVRYAASLLQAGCNKTNSLFAQEYSEKRELALGRLG